MSRDPDRSSGHLLDACIGILLAAMALYGAVQIMSVIWKPLCIALAVIAVLGAIGWLIYVRIRRW